jgi:hypothetical protein
MHDPTGVDGFRFVRVDAGGEPVIEDDPADDVALAGYLAAQAAVAALRDRPQPEPPWPDPDNVMLDFLIERAKQLAGTDGVEPALVWLAVHAWREAALHERARMMRALEA